jgi:ABC-type bacteriocin/lantibiotic exporter with double-glycine peptidase domain
MKNGNVIIGDPGKNRITKMPLEHFFSQWQGQIITFTPNDNFEKKNECKGAMSKYFKFITTQKRCLPLYLQCPFWCQQLTFLAL